jgi:uncharacterized repeat protein (TIGR01451 family)
MRVRVLAPVVAVLTVLTISPGGIRSPAVRAQAPGPEPKSADAVNFAESVALRDLPIEAVVPSVGDNDFERPNKELPKATNAAEVGDSDAAIAAALAAPGPFPAPLLSFDGLSNQDNFTNFGFRLSPPDNDGEVGPHHFVQYVNLLFRVYDKTGAPLTGPIKLSALYTPLGGLCAGPDRGDPIVLYDQLADRWLISQFAFVGTGTEPPYHECIAISKTGDPTGQYYLYDFLVPTVQFNDYPKIGVWPDAYYMTANQFNRGVAFDGTGAFAFNRAKMLAGDPTANMIYFNLDLASHPEAIGGMLPSDVDGLNPPPPAAPNVFVYFLANEFLDAIDGLRFFDFRPDFAVPANSTFTERQAPLPVPAFDPRSPAGRADVEQPPPALATHALDSIQDRLMFRLAYRNFGTHESLVVNHSVNVTSAPTVTQATHQAGVRYYELRRTAKDGPFGVHVAETIAPDTDNRWMASAAQDNTGNIAIGYSVSSLTTFPAIRYSGRLTDGSARTEASLVEGSGVQRSTGSRWGDYTAISIDPVDDCTFWYTNQYYTAESQATSTVGWLTRNGAFKFDECKPAPRARLSGRIVNILNGRGVPGALIDLGNGRLTSSGPDGRYEIYTLPGTYAVRVTAPNYFPRTGTAKLSDRRDVINVALLPKGTDVFVTQTGPAQAQGLTDLTYTLTIGNNGPLPAFNVELTEAIPAGTTFVSAVQSRGFCKKPAVGGGGTLTCVVPFLAAGDTETVVLTLHSTDPAGTVHSVATVTGLLFDAVRHNNTATVTTFLTCGSDINVSAGPIGTAAVNGLQVGRLFRSGAPSVCAFPKAFPGLGAATGNRKFDAYQYTNEGTSSACVTVEVTAAASCASNLLYSASYLGAFNPADISQNFLADLGSSPSPAVGVPTLSFSFDVPAAATFTLVFHEVNPQPTTVACGAYSFVVKGVPKACSTTSSAPGPFSSVPVEPAAIVPKLDR